jgi:hypothetical protein
MGGNRGWWELPEDTVAERERKYQWHEVKQVAGIKVLESKYKKMVLFRDILILQTPCTSI